MTIDHYLKWDNPWAVCEAAMRIDVALDAAVFRVIDSMFEYQTWHWHKNPGYQPYSSTAKAGEAPGGGGCSDQALIAAERWQPDSEWHQACRRMMECLPRRQAAAMLIQAARVRPGDHEVNLFSGTWSELLQRQALLLRRLHMAEGVAPYESVIELQSCAKRARRHLRQWIRKGLLRRSAA